MDSINITLLIKMAFLLAFVLFIPISAASYYANRKNQRNLEILRYITILGIDSSQISEYKNTGFSFALPVLFLSFITSCYWILVLLGIELGVTDSYGSLFGALGFAPSHLSHPEAMRYFFGGQLLTFNMAFLGAYLWGVQNLTRRYSMNDLTSFAYYSIGGRMIIASILALVIFNLDDALGSSFEVAAYDVRDQYAMPSYIPVIGFLIGMFPQSGLIWLTDKIAALVPKTDHRTSDLPLDMIEGITIYDRIRLRESGIIYCYDLANIDYVSCLFKTPYSLPILINWILQAKMCVYFGMHVKDLRERGIHTVWQINSYDIAELKELVKSTSLTEEQLILVQDLISKDREIERLVTAQLRLSQYWRANEEDIEYSDTDDHVPANQ